MLKNIIFGIFILFMLGGCATPYDVDLQEAYTTGVADHDEYQYMTISDTAESMSKLKATVSDTADPRDKAMAAMQNIMIAQAMANISYHASTLKAPTLNTDNVGSVTRMISAGIPIWGMFKVTEVAAENFTGVTTLTTTNGNVGVADSLNRTESHATSVKGGDATLSASASRDENPVTTDYAPVPEPTTTVTP